MSSLLLLVHLVGLALAVGASTTKLLLLLQARRDQAFVPVFLQVAAPVTRLILSGIVLLTLSGIIWLLLGYPLTGHLVAKLVLVAGIWMIGPIIDRVAEPRYRRLAPAPGSAVSAPFLRAQRLYLALEIVATLLFYAVIIYWVLT